MRLYCWGWISFPWGRNILPFSSCPCCHVLQLSGAELCSVDTYGFCIPLSPLTSSPTDLAWGYSPLTVPVFFEFPPALCHLRPSTQLCPTPCTAKSRYFSGLILSVIYLEWAALSFTTASCFLFLSQKSGFSFSFTILITVGNDILIWEVLFLCLFITENSCVSAQYFSTSTSLRAKNILKCKEMDEAHRGSDYAIPQQPCGFVQFSYLSSPYFTEIQMWLTVDHSWGDCGED